MMITQNSCSSVRWLMFSIFFTRLAAISSVVSFFCKKTNQKKVQPHFILQPKKSSSNFSSKVLWESSTHIVFQAFNDLDAIVTQIEFLQVDKVLKPFYFSNPITLKIQIQPKLILILVSELPQKGAFITLPECLKQRGCVKHQGSEAYLFYSCQETNSSKMWGRPGSQWPVKKVKWHKCVRKEPQSCKDPSLHTRMRLEPSSSISRELKCSRLAMPVILLWTRNSFFSWVNRSRFSIFLKMLNDTSSCLWVHSRKYLQN